MHQHTDLICDHLAEQGIAGFAIVAWGFDGSFLRGTRIHQEGFIGLTLMPSVVAEILRRDISQDVAEDVFRGEL